VTGIENQQDMAGRNVTDYPQELANIYVFARVRFMREDWHDIAFFNLGVTYSALQSRSMTRKKYDQIISRADCFGQIILYE
jgi:hypothetical protein